MVARQALKIHVDHKLKLVARHDWQDRAEKDRKKV